MSCLSCGHGDATGVPHIHTSLTEQGHEDMVVSSDRQSLVAGRLHGSVSRFRRAATDLGRQYLRGARWHRLAGPVCGLGLCAPRSSLTSEGMIQTMKRMSM